jgi:hypothetical protein
MKLIGLNGAIGSGKSEAARFLSDKYGYKEITFKAEFVRRIFLSLGICDRHPDHEIYLNLFYDQELKDKSNELLGGLTPREVKLSFSGWVRSIDPDAFVKPTELKIKTYSKLKTQSLLDIVVSDVRFDNEAQLIKRNGGVIWKIERQNNPFKIKSSHESEKDLDKKYIDLTIHNDGSLDDLAIAIGDVLEAAVV